MIEDDWLMTFGILSVAVSNIAFIPYVRDMLSGKTLPLRSTWLIWTVLSGMSFFSNVDEGATVSLMYIGSEALETTFIFLLAIRYGIGGFLCKGNLLILGIAGLGLGLWAVTDDAIYALAIVIAISALGGWVTIVKTYRDPGTETTSCWALSALSALLGMLSVGVWDPVLLVYPLYLFLLYIGILAAIGLGRRRATGIAAAPAPGPDHRAAPHTLTGKVA